MFGSSKQLQAQQAHIARLEEAKDAVEARRDGLR